jgi:hypothetical protein
MSTTTFRVLLNGIKRDQQVERVAAQLADLLKAPPEKIFGLLSTTGVVLKRGLDLQTAAKYQSALDKIGCHCSVEQDVGPGPASAVTTATTPAAPSLGDASAALGAPTDDKPNAPARRVGKALMYGVGPAMIVVGVWKVWVAVTLGGGPFFAADALIRNSLRAPSSYSVVDQRLVHEQPVGKNKGYVVRTEFDAQNAFGVPIRGCYYAIFVIDADRYRYQQNGLEECATPEMQALGYNHETWEHAIVNVAAKREFEEIAASQTPVASPGASPTGSATGAVEQPSTLAVAQAVTPPTQPLASIDLTRLHEIAPSQYTDGEDRTWRDKSPTKFLSAVADLDGDGADDSARLLLTDNSEQLVLLVTTGAGTRTALFHEPATELTGRAVEVIQPQVLQTACGKGYWECSANEPASVDLKRPALVSSISGKGAAVLHYWNERTRAFDSVPLSE